MIVQCPHCGKTVVVGGLGRKRLDVPVKNILDSLRKLGSVMLVARQLRCSRGYIYSVLKANGLKLKDVISQWEFDKQESNLCQKKSLKT